MVLSLGFPHWNDYRALALTACRALSIRMQWCGGESFEGVVCFDESHKAKNSMGDDRKGGTKGMPRRSTRPLCCSRTLPSLPALAWGYLHSASTFRGGGALLSSWISVCIGYLHSASTFVLTNCFNKSSVFSRLPDPFSVPANMDQSFLSYRPIHLLCSTLHSFCSGRGVHPAAAHASPRSGRVRVRDGSDGAQPHGPHGALGAVGPAYVFTLCLLCPLSVSLLLPIRIRLRCKCFVWNGRSGGVLNP